MKFTYAGVSLEKHCPTAYVILFSALMAFLVMKKTCAVYSDIVKLHGSN